MKSEDRDFEINFFSRLVEKSPDYVDALIPLAEAYTRKGLHEEGLQIDLRLSKLCSRDPVVHYNLACSYALVGKTEVALETLMHSVRLGYRDLKQIRSDPDLRILHDHPEFKKLTGMTP